MSTKQKRRFDLYRRLEAMGFTFEESEQLRRIEMTLNRWSEAECNGEIQRDETTGKPYRHYGSGAGPFQTCKVSDRESGALARLSKIMATHPDFVAYHQGDPRGCALYIVAKKDLIAPENQIVRAAQNLGCEIKMHKTSTDKTPLVVRYSFEGCGESFDCPEQAAMRFLKVNGKHVPSRNYEIDQVYNRGLAICD